MEFEIGGHKYRSTKMGAIEQFLLTVKIGPLIAKVGSVSEAMKPPGEGGGIAALGPFLEALASFPEDDLRDILAKCLTVVQRQSGAGFMPVWNKAGARPQFEDIDMVQMLMITWQVIQDNLANFTSGLAFNLTVTAGPAPNSTR